MKLFLLFMVGATATGCVSAYRSLAVLRETNVVQGPAIGFAGEEGSFSKCYRKVASLASDAEVTAMMKDDHPPVRLMGFVVALHRWPENRQFVMQRAALDLGDITIVDGCDPLGVQTTIAGLVAAEAESTSVEKKYTRLLARR